MRPLPLLSLACVVVLAGCSAKVKQEPVSAVKVEPAPNYFKVDPATAGVVTGTIRYAGKKPNPVQIDMSNEPACVSAHKGKAYDESLMVGHRG